MTGEPPATRISVELVPRSGHSVQADVVAVDEFLPHVDTINVPDLTKFALRSWDACALTRQVPRNGGRTAYRAIPHLRSRDLDPHTALPMARALDESGIQEVLVVTGDLPNDFSGATYDVDAVAAIRRLRADLPHLSVYAGLDPYRHSLTQEMEYVERKLEAGAAGFFTQPFFDVALMRAWAGLIPSGVPVWWGATTVTSPGSRSYWQRRNRVVFPTGFEATLEWHRDFARRAVAFACQRGQHIYLMPVAVDVRSYLEGIV